MLTYSGIVIISGAACVVCASVWMAILALRHRERGFWLYSAVLATLSVLLFLFVFSGSPGSVSAWLAGAVSLLAGTLALAAASAESRRRRSIAGAPLTVTDREFLARVLPDTVFCMGADGTIIEYLPAAGFRAYRAPEEFLGKSVLEVLPKHVADKAMACIDRVLGSDEHCSFEYELEIDGETGYFEARLVPDGRESVLATVRDVTERHSAEEALHTAGRRYRALFEEAPLMYVVTELRNDIPVVSDCNLLFLERLGYAREEVIGSPLTNFYAKESRHALLQGGGYRRALAGNLQEEERVMLTRQGRRVETLVRAVPQLDRDGRVWGTRAAYVDVTARRAIERRLDGFFRQSLDGCFFMEIEDPVRWDDSVDKEGVLDYVFEHQRVTDANDAMLRQYEASQAMFIGLRPLDFFEHDMEHGRALWRKLFDEGRIELVSEERNFTDREMWIEGEYVCMYDERGYITGHFGIQRDVTKRRRREDQREALISDLEARNQELERFTYTVSHDLKAPLVTIQGFLGLFEEDLRRERIPQVLQDMQRVGAAATRMQNLIEDLLELTRVGRVANPPQSIQLTDLVEDGLRLVSGRIDARSVQVEVQPDLPMIFGDRMRLLEVIQNLLDNAAKFMGKQRLPRITISAMQRDDEIICCVRDNGIGIEKGNQAHIFRLFERLHSSEDGTGVGLALAKRIIEIHGGRIWVESEGVGHGCAFYFALPSEARSDPSAETAGPTADRMRSRV